MTDRAPMGEEDFKSIQWRIREETRKYRLSPEELEDITMNICVKRLEGKGAHQPLEYAVIDGIRHMFGDSRNPNYEAKREVERPIDSLSDPDQVIALRTRVPSVFQTKSKEDWKKFKSGFDKDESMILTLYYEWGLTLKEIGEGFGLQESRICQIHTAILEKAEKRIAGERYGI